MDVLDPDWVVYYGLPALFLICFAAATVLPFSSEVAFAAALSTGYSPYNVLIIASLGNVLGASTNYLLGYLASEAMHQKLENDRWGKKVVRWFDRFGVHLIWLNPLPLVGDPVCILAGIQRMNLQLFILAVFGLRVARYFLIIALW